MVGTHRYYRIIPQRLTRFCRYASDQRGHRSSQIAGHNGLCWSVQSLPQVALCGGKTANVRSENDQVFPDDVREEGRKYLESKNIEHEIKVYSNVPHGKCW